MEDLNNLSGTSAVSFLRNLGTTLLESSRTLEATQAPSSSHSADAGFKTATSASTAEETSRGEQSKGRSELIIIHPS